MWNFFYGHAISWKSSDLFGSDHGIGAVLPFIKHFLPSVPIVPIAISIDSRRDQWDALARRLRRMVDTRTFIIQSTDFSHHLAPFQAVQRDQEVLNILAADSLESVARLRQLQQTDLRGSQYLQTRLQRDVFHARPNVFFEFKRAVLYPAPERRRVKRPQSGRHWRSGSRLDFQCHCCEALAGLQTFGGIIGAGSERTTLLPRIQ